MQLGLIGLGKMGGNMRERLRRAGHEVVGFDRDPKVSDVRTMAAMVKALDAPRTVWVMVPAGAATQDTITKLGDLLDKGDLVIDGGNSRFTDDIAHAKMLKAKGIGFVDCGVSGGVWGLQNGYGLMCGGETRLVNRVMPIFDALRPEGPREEGFVHAGDVGAGHYTKMVHNGIEYGLMAAYAEGLNVLKHANAGLVTRAVDAETTPLKHPELFSYQFDLAAIAEVWRHGSVVRSWLLDLAAAALERDGSLAGFHGQVSDSGEGRWTIDAAIESGVPVPVLATALFARFSSRGEDEFANRLLSAMRLEFGGHVERPADPGAVKK